MEDKLGTKIIGSVERVLRYLIPGVAFCILFALSCPEAFDETICKIPDNDLFVFLIILSVGISIYVIHSLIIRFTLEPIVYWLKLSPVNVFSNNRCLCNYSKAHAKLIVNREKSPHYPKEYYIYLWSITHYSFIMSYLLLFFAYWREEHSWVDSNAKFIAIGGVIILLLSIFSYLYMQALEKNTTATINSNETPPEKCGK